MKKWHVWFTVISSETLHIDLQTFPFSVFPAAGLQQLGGAILEITMVTKVRLAILFEGQKERESEVCVSVIPWDPQYSNKRNCKRG